VSERTCEFCYERPAVTETPVDGYAICDECAEPRPAVGCKCGKGYWYSCEGLWLHRVLFGHTPTWDEVWRGE